MIRCGWVPDGDPLYLAYHDEEWGVPSHDDRHLFELLTLEGAQAGLSWATILRKREGYRRAFAGFDPEVVARFTDRDVERLLADPGIVRHRGKIESTVSNARRAGDWRELPAETEESRAMSRDLKRRGFRFVGPTTCYSLMQAAGLVNDHETSCFRHRAVGAGPGHAR